MMPAHAFMLELIEAAFPLLKGESVSADATRWRVRYEDLGKWLVFSADRKLARCASRDDAITVAVAMNQWACSAIGACAVWTTVSPSE